MRKLAAAIVLLSAAVAQPAFPTSPTQFGEARLMQSDGQQIATFSQCVSIGTSNDIVAIMGGGTGATVEVPGNLHTGDIVCSRAATDDLTLWNWRQDLINGKSSAFVDGKLQLVDPTGAVLLTWTFSHGWPSKIFYNIGSAIITESIALTTDQLSRTGAALVPTITWTPLPLTYGDLLGSSQLNASTTAAGTFTYDPPAGTVLTAGTHTLKATFQPADPTQFQSVTVSADVTVSPALLTARADDVTKVYGSSNPNLTYTLSGFVNGENTSVVSGAPLLSTTATTSSDVGSYPVTISAGTLQAANYTFQFTGGQLSITKADQTIKWAAPAAIVYGTALSSTQLNATVSVVGPALAGALTYSPAAGTVLHAGDQLLTLNVAATNDYNAATASVHLTVLKATPAFSSLSSPIIAKGTAATPLSGTISAKAVSIPAGENVVITLLATSQNAAIQTDGSFSSNFATAALAVSSTPYPVNYNYPGDADFNAISGSGSLTVAYIDALSATIKTPAVDNENENRPFAAKVDGSVAGSVAGDFTAFVNYTPVTPGAGVTSNVTDGTWKLHAIGGKSAPKGIVTGKVTGGIVQWNADGTQATVTLQMTIDSGNGDFAHVTGSASFVSGVWDATTKPQATISGQLLLFY